MPNTREKLIELINCGRMHHTVCSSRGHPVRSFESRLVDEGAVELLADHLIANGVTVLKWIPVSERLPEKYETVLTYDGYSVEPGVFYGNSYFYELDNEAYPLFGITHWMPLPDPPEVAP